MQLQSPPARPQFMLAAAVLFEWWLVQYSASWPPAIFGWDKKGNPKRSPEEKHIWIQSREFNESHNRMPNFATLRFRGENAFALKLRLLVNYLIYWLLMLLMWKLLCYSATRRPIEICVSDKKIVALRDFKGIFQWPVGKRGDQQVFAHVDG